jgi:hypothetical protein
LIKAQQKATKNSKTGKVTAVVAVMKIFGNKIVNSRNSRSGKMEIKPKTWLNSKKKHLNRSKPHHKGFGKPNNDASKGTIAKTTMRVLLDTGLSGDLLFIRKGSHKFIPTWKRNVPQSWGTSNGTFQTKKVGDIDISFVEYSASKSVRLTPDIVEYDSGANAPMYDLIIGKQTLHDIGAVLDFKDRSVTIDNILLPTRNIATLQLNSSITRALRQNRACNPCLAQEPVSTQDGIKRVIAILDAKYDNADLPAIIGDNCSHLTASHRELLLSLLLKYEELFDGTLGDWNRPPVSTKLKEGAKPFHGRPYPIAQIHKATLMREINSLASIGVLKKHSSSEWASPTFIIPQKDMTLRTISDFMELNKRIIRRPFPIPKISTTLQELEGFTYATALDLNMGYYTIRLDPMAVKMCTIIFPFGKYSQYPVIPTCMVADRITSG